jgi:hypothetical protein
MKALLLAILILVAVELGYPLLNESTGNVCSALERRLITLTTPRHAATAVTLAALQRTFSNGAVLRTVMKKRNPNLPPVLTCGLAYWRLLLNHNQAEPLIKELAADYRGDRNDRLLGPPPTPAEQAKAASRALLNPAPAAAPAAPPPPRYPASDRRQLDRVIGNQR